MLATPHQLYPTGSLKCWQLALRQWPTLLALPDPIQPQWLLNLWSYHLSGSFQAIGTFLSLLKPLPHQVTPPYQLI